MNDGGRVAGRSTTRDGWEMVWHDEFGTPTVDRTKWGFDIGDRLHVPELDTWIVGWGEESLQYHTDRPDNVCVENGHLTIRARRESYKGCGYTSARMNTKGLFEKLYGRFEIRARLPVGRGLWGGIGLFPARNAYGLWPASGEMDIAETAGQRPGQVHGTIHFGSTVPYNTHATATYTFPRGGIGDFHVYAFEWEPGVMRWYVDDVLYSTKTGWWSCGKRNARGVGEPPADAAECSPFPAPFDRPFYLAMMQNVGGTVPGLPDESTPFPSDMLVDYVRVFDRADGYGEKAAEQATGVDPATRGAEPP